jgi:hypothetical protein
MMSPRTIALALLLCVSGAYAGSISNFTLSEESGACESSGVHFMPSFVLDAADNAFTVSSNNGILKGAGYLIEFPDDNDDDNDDDDDSEEGYFISFAYASDCQGVAYTKAAILNLVCSVSNVGSFSSPVVCTSKYSYPIGQDDDNTNGSKPIVKSTKRSKKRKVFI